MLCLRLWVLVRGGGLVRGDCAGRGSRAQGGRFVESDPLVESVGSAPQSAALLPDRSPGEAIATPRWVEIAALSPAVAIPTRSHCEDARGGGICLRCGLFRRVLALRFSGSIARRPLLRAEPAGWLRSSIHEGMEKPVPVGPNLVGFRTDNNSQRPLPTVIRRYESGPARRCASGDPALGALARACRRMSDGTPRQLFESVHEPTPPGAPRSDGGRVVSDTDDVMGHDSRRQLIRRAGLVALLMRHCAVVIAAAVVLFGPAAGASQAGRLLLGIFGVWSVYRLMTRSFAPVVGAVDYGLTIAVCLAIPALVSDPHFHTTNSAAVAIAGTAVISFAVSVPTRLSLAMTLGIAASYAYGAAAVIGWPHVVEVFNLYYFALQWATASLIRMLVLRVADAVDAAGVKRHAAELSERVTSAVRDYDREQLRLLHDTVASTLLMVGHGTALPPDRLAAQASRDLALLGENPWAPPPRIDLVVALREVAAHVHTPVCFRGLSVLWLDGQIGTQVAGATREAMTNVDRHAAASTMTVEIGADRVQIADDGVGFNPDHGDGGRGIPESILARMTQIGGKARISSTPGHGSKVQLYWGAKQDVVPPKGRSDSARLIERTRISYSVALSGYAIANLAVMAPASFTTADHTLTQIVLAAAAAAATLSALPALLNKHWWPPWPAVASLLVIALAQVALLPATQLGTQSQWSQASIGWCLLPLVVRQPLRLAAALLCLYWIAMAAFTLARDPSAQLMVNVGLGTASVLTVQLFALLFYGLIRDAAHDARAQTDARLQSTARDRINAALQAEYRRRYADLAARIRPLLITLSQAAPLDTALRRRAQTEHQRLRALFDQSASFDHPLLGVLRPLIDAAECRRVDVSVHVDGPLPPIDSCEVQLLVDALGHALRSAATSARITLTSSRRGIEASITATGVLSAQSAAQINHEGHDVLEVTTLEDRFWLTIRRNDGKGAPDALTDAPAT